MGLDDLVAKTLSDPIFFRYEELIFDIDVFLCIANKVDVGVHHRMLGL